MKRTGTIPDHSRPRPDPARAARRLLGLLALALTPAAGCGWRTAPPPAPAPPVIVAPFATPPASVRPPLRICTPRPAPPGQPLSIALETSARWPNGKTLRIAFHGGRVADRQAVLNAAAEWSRYANIRFVQSADRDSEIRCSFNQGDGSWSYLGTEALHIPLNQATMNCGWPDDSARDLHEVGHALGFVHEHQLPDAKIPWDRAKVYAYFGGAPNFWSVAMVDAQIIDRLNANTLTNFGWDGHSIMEYAFPGELLTDPSRAIPWNKVLSPEDKTSAARVYPYPTAPPTKKKAEVEAASPGKAE